MKLKKVNVNVPELVLLAATRGMIGAGVGLLLADKLSSKRRKAVGWPLFTVGALSTIPLALRLFGKGNKLLAMRRQKGGIGEWFTKIGGRQAGAWLKG